MKLFDIAYSQDCYVYSTSYRFRFPFTFAPCTTVAPINRDFSRAVSFLWNRKDRHLLPLLHLALYEAVQKWGLDRLYRLSVLAFTWRGGSPRVALKILAEGAKQSGDQFLLPELTMQCVRSFAPVKWPSGDQLQEARAVWSGGLTKAKKDPG